MCAMEAIPSFTVLCIRRGGRWICCWSFVVAGLKPAELPKLCKPVLHVDIDLDEPSEVEMQPTPKVAP